MLMGADIPAAEPMRSACVTLTVDSAEEAERVYGLLDEHPRTRAPSASPSLQYAGGDVRVGMACIPGPPWPLPSAPP